ncbi:ABC transporter substrate-binding protein [Desertimonas flava]|uniref:ABC transporter substrate-binding protein n=1 Tax=Desertimonas flava TaxID=2064846 RepID=UPI000E350EB6|nr:ABC transporter substrate-binding protein [Desertimonas flava]
MTSPLPSPTLSRRRLLLTGLVAGGALGAARWSPLHAASAGGRRPTSAEFGDLSIALSWIKDVTFAGAFIADADGLFAAAGFGTVDFIAGGGNSLPPTAQLLNGDVLIAYSGPEAAAAAVQQGGDVKIVGTLFQKNPLSVISPADAPIETPADLAGRRIGVYAGGEAALEYFLTLNGVDPGSVTQVPTNYDPLVLTTGEVDGYLGYSFDEPNTLLARGFETAVMLYADFGYNSLSQAYAVRDEDLDANREALIAYFAAEIAGWKANVADPAKGTELVVSTYGIDAGLDPEHQALQNESQIPLIATEETETIGLLTISPDLAASTVDSLAAGGIDVTADDIFDLTLLADVYEAHPDLLG